jgi:hypothetical protein
MLARLDAGPSGEGDALDNSHTGTLVRYAADGIWLSELTEGRTMSPAPAVAGQRSDEDDASCVKHVEAAMRYNIHARLIYDAMDGTLTLPGSDEPDSQLSITANALLWFFLRHTEVVSRDEVLKSLG